MEANRSSKLTCGRYDRFDAASTVARHPFKVGPAGRTAAPPIAAAVCLLSDLKQGKPLKLTPHDAVAFTGRILEFRAVLNGYHSP